MSLNHASLAARVVGAGIDIGSVASAFQSELAFETADSTVINNSARTFTFGDTSGTFSLEAFLSTESGVGLGDGSWETILRAIKANNAIIQCPIGDAVGKPALGMIAGGVKSGLMNSIGTNVGAKLEGQTQNGPDAGVVLEPFGTHAATWNGATVDAGAASAATVSTVAYVAWTGLTGTSVNLKLQHSTDGATWADVAAFPAITTSKGGARTVPVVGTLNRYRRIIENGGTFTNVKLIAMLATINQ